MGLLALPDYKFMTQTETLNIEQAAPAPTNTDSADLSADQAVESAELVTRFVVVEINKNMYGISTDTTVELMDSATIQITRVSHAPKFIQGVINHRGTIIPVINSRAMLGFEDLALTDSEDDTESKGMIVITELESQKLGLVVDAVHSVFDCPKKDIEPLPESTENSQFLQGLVHQDDGSYVLITDIDYIHRVTKPD